MNKEEILEMSRKENKNSAEFELRVLEQSGRIAMKVGGVLCMMMLI